MDTSASVRRAQPLLGTIVEIAASGEAAGDLQDAVDEAFGAVAQVHRLMSFHDAESDVSRLNREAFAGAVQVHAWTFEVLDAALELYRRSGGLFDIAIAPLLQRCGLLPRSANGIDLIPEKTIPSDQIELLAGHYVRYRDPRVRIDLGGIAKGYAVDRALEVLRRRGLPRGLVNAGGDLAAFGARPESIYIRNPNDACRALCLVELRNSALASSGRLFDPLKFAILGDSAVVDPSTGTPVRAVAGASVCAPRCTIADALTKVVMIAGTGATELLQQYKASALLVSESGDVRITPDWQNAIRLAA